MFWILGSCVFVSQKDFEDKRTIFEVQCDEAPLLCSDIGPTEDIQLYGCCHSTSLYYCTNGIFEDIDCQLTNQECGFEESNMNCIGESETSCTDTCEFANDGQCDDEQSQNFSGTPWCSAGTDCTDCQ